jgi:hypothetical protein
MYGSVFVDVVGVVTVDVVFAAVDVFVEFLVFAILIGEVATSLRRCRDRDGVVCDATSSLYLEFFVCLGIRCLELVR